MKLNILPASAGARWVKLGLRTFFRQPLALSGFFLVFALPISLLSLIPWVGILLQTVLLPATILGMMTATQAAEAGRFPGPRLMLTAFTAGAQRARAMLLLGVWWAAGVACVFGISALIDGGELARHYLGGAVITPEIAQQPRFQAALLVALGLGLVLTMVFWHSPGLTFFGGLPPLKCFFFSAVASMKNIGAYLVYSLLWPAVMLLIFMVVAVILMAIGGEALLKGGILPLMLLLTAMSFTPVVFSFRDSFELDPLDTPEKKMETT